MTFLNFRKRRFLFGLLLIGLSVFGAVGCHDWSSDFADEEDQSPTPEDDDTDVGDDDNDNDDTAGLCNGCLIDSACYNDGQTSLDNPCLFCDVEQATDAWSFHEGAACNDGLFCNGIDLCDDAGECVHQGDPCLDNRLCKSICNEDEDNCLAPDTTSCDDGVFCNGEDFCDGAGNCVHAGNPCADGDACNNYCNEDEANCSAPASRICDDGLFCNGQDHCDGAGTCEHSGDPCAEGDACNNTCNEDTDDCFSPNTRLCPDGIMCNGIIDICDGTGTCLHSGDPCAGGDVCNQCNEAEQSCYSPNTTSCEDDIYCNGADLCDGAGTCVHEGDPCAGGNDCNQCNEEDDTCLSPTGTDCEDDVFCNGDDSCNGYGTCSVHLGNPCLSGDVCNNSCNEITDDCFSTDTTPCVDDLYCNGELDMCDGAGVCVHPGDPCPAGDACNQCNEDDDNCLSPIGTNCEDGLFCNGEDTCDGVGDCGHAGDPCVGGDVCNDTCNEDTDDCFSPESTDCDDGEFCNGEDSCDGAGDCGHSGDPCLGGDTCNQCNENDDNCLSPIGTDCEDGLFCNGEDTCDGAGACSVHPGNPCNLLAEDCIEDTASCDPALHFVMIPDGVFTMGSPTGELGREDDETQHEVTLTHSFEIMVTEVTRGQFLFTMGYDPSVSTVCPAADCPVENVSWYDAVAYSILLTEDDGLSPCYQMADIVCRSGELDSIDNYCLEEGGIESATVTLNGTDSVYECEGYRLPTEAEWEYTARADTTTAFYSGDITFTDCTLDPNLDPIGWYCGNQNTGTEMVGQKLANSRGLYDTAGNAWEWAWDSYASYSGAVVDPESNDGASPRVTRGGGYADYAENCRSARRYGDDPDYRGSNLGFRVVRTISMSHIPESAFWMGCEPGDSLCGADETPRHKVYVSGFYMDKHEVTNAEYADYLNNVNPANECYGEPCAYSTHDNSYLGLWNNDGAWEVDDGYADRPAIYITWQGAMAYCAAMGKRLPTEAEWEKATKGDFEHSLYPWGDAWSANAANWKSQGDPFETGTMPWTTPVGYFDGTDHAGVYLTSDGRSPYGIHDMGGNAWEWVYDWYQEDYYSIIPDDGWINPLGGDGDGTYPYHGLRGGVWGLLESDAESQMRSSYRDHNIGTLQDYGIGFRCVRPVNDCFDNGDGTVSCDSLMWQQTPTGGEMTWDQASSWCDSLILASYEDWRLPTISDLRRLIRECSVTETAGICAVTDSCSDMYVCACPECDTGCTENGGPDNGYYRPWEMEGEGFFLWSSTILENSESYAWTVVDAKAQINAEPKSHYANHFARCVRNEPLFFTGLDFDGIDDYVEVATGGIADLTEGTFETWFRIDVLPAEWASISEADQWGGACKSFQLSVDYDGSITGKVRCNEPMVSTDPVPVDEWHHVAFVWDAALQKDWIYLDGELQDEHEDTDTVGVISPTHYTFGCGNSGNSPNYSCFADVTINQIRLSDTAKYTETSFEPPLTFIQDADTVSLYLFDEGTGAVVGDSVGGYHGAINGDPVWF